MGSNAWLKSASARQEILTRDNRPRLWAVVDEAVIRRVVGGTEVMRGQLRYLADSAQQGKTTIQVVPYRAGAHAGTTGPFVILDFEEPTDPSMVYVETLAGDIYLTLASPAAASISVRIDLRTIDPRTRRRQ